MVQNQATHPSTHEMPTPKFTVAIIGGGITGLSLAIELGKYPDVAVHLYEAASRFGELGVGLRFSPRSWNVFEKLGVDQELLKFTNMRPSNEEHIMGIQRKSDQLEGFAYGNLTVAGSPMMFYRADCQTALLNCLPPSCRVSLSKRLASYNHDGSRIELCFQDGSKAECDVLVGADGYKSAVRRCLLQERAKFASSEKEASEILSATEPLFSGAVAYRTTVPADKVRELCPEHSVFSSGNVPIIYSGMNASGVAYPLQHQSLINFGIVDMNFELENTIYDGPHTAQAETSEFASVVKGFEKEVQTMAKCVNGITKWALHTVKPMSTFVHQNVALIGDAAHAMTMFLGAGASQGVEDAYILATALGHPNTTRETLGRALVVYDTIRRPVALAVQENSRKSGHYACFRMEGINFENRTDPEDLWEDLQRVSKARQELVTGADIGVVDGPYEEVLRMLL